MSKRIFLLILLVVTTPSAEVRVDPSESTIWINAKNVKEVEYPYFFFSSDCLNKKTINHIPSLLSRLIQHSLIPHASLLTFGDLLEGYWAGFSIEEELWINRAVEDYRAPAHELEYTIWLLAHELAHQEQRAFNGYCRNNLENYFHRMKASPSSPKYAKMLLKEQKDLDPWCLQVFQELDFRDYTDKELEHKRDIMSDLEIHADLRGIRLLYKAGFDPCYSLLKILTPDQLNNPKRLKHREKYARDDLKREFIKKEFGIQCATE